MPMGGVNGGTNCRVCVDCELMVAGTEFSYRCYGESESAPLKKDFARNEARPPRIAPDWCPHRKRNRRSVETTEGERVVERLAKWMWCQEAGYTWSDDAVNDYETELAKATYEKKARQFLVDILYSWGIRVLSDKQDLPDVYDKHSRLAKSLERFKDDMLGPDKDGNVWVKVRPEEKK